MFCTNCGARIQDDARFCPVCGASCDAGYPGSTGAGCPGVAGGAGYPGNTSAMPATPVTPGAGQAAGRPRRKGVSIAVIVVSCVVLVVVGVLLGWMYLSGRLGGEAETQNQSDVAISAQTDDTSDDLGSGTSVAAQVKQALNLQISQVDNSSFPKMTLYASLTDGSGNALEAIDASALTVSEIGTDGATHEASIEEVSKLVAGDDMSVNLVLDQSGSMKSSSKMANAKSAASSFIDEMSTASGTAAEVTSFDDTVYSRQPFTSEVSLLKSAVNSLSPSGQTALNDALYWALQRTNLRSGSRVVIAFTDGVENASYYSKSDVIELAKLTGIPVYIIGIGSDVEKADLQSLAVACGGSYFDAATDDLATVLASIYDDIYTTQRSLFRVVYTSSYGDATESYRTVRLACADGAAYEGSCEKEYMPVDNVSKFDNSANTADYVLADSSTRYYSRSELEGLSLWQLYLARNEIFARYGRGFKNQDLVEYFATRRWYTERYSPEEFDAMASPLNDYEMKNTELMLEIEKERNSPYLTTSE